MHLLSIVTHSISLCDSVKVEKQKMDDGDASDDDQPLYINDFNASTKHSYENVELKPKRNAAVVRTYLLKSPSRLLL